MRRALLIGCQTDGLVGVHADLEAMAGLVACYGFSEVTTLRDRQADRAGILAGIDGLISRAGPGDAVLLYYSGHGWWIDVPGGAARPDDGPRSYQGISPWDLRDTTHEDFRGILAAELSTRVADLTRKTDNVSVILDCCHATGIVRGPTRARGERGLPIPWTAGVARCLAALREQGYALERRDPESNPLAVRLLACSPHQRAHEDRGEHGGLVGGLLTRALVAELAACDHAEVVWEDLARRVQARVHARNEAQDPVVLGPARRFLFSSDARSELGATALVTAGERRFLVGGAMTGMQVGDRYAALPLAPARGEARRGGGAEPLVGALARVEVTAVHGHLAEVRSDRPDVELPSGTTARPIRRAASEAAVALALREAWRPAASAALMATGQLRVVATDETATARIVEVAGGLQARDADGRPLGPTLRIAGDAEFDAALAGLCVQIEAAAQVDALRRLRSLAPLDPRLHPFALEWFVVDGGQRRSLAPGSRLRPGARVTLRIANHGSLLLHCSALQAGPGGHARLLSRSQPAGVELAPGDTYWLGEPGLTGVEGVRLGWPAGLPEASEARPVTLVCVLSDLAVDLRAWETGGAELRGGPSPPAVAPGGSLRAACYAVVSLDVVIDASLPRS